MSYSQRKKVIQRLRNIDPGVPPPSLEFYVCAFMSQATTLSPSEQQECLWYVMKRMWEPTIGSEALECVSTSIHGIMERTWRGFKEMFMSASVSKNAENELVDGLMRMLTMVMREAMLVEILSEVLVNDVTRLMGLTEKHALSVVSLVRFLLVHSWDGIYTEEIVVRSAIYLRRASKYCRRHRWALSKALFVALVIGTKMASDNTFELLGWVDLYETLTTAQKKCERYIQWEMSLLSEGLGWDLHVREPTYQQVRQELLSIVTAY